MRECQLCGCKSWGPLTARGRALLLNAVRPEDTEVDFTAYRECDNCAMPAQVQIVERPAAELLPTIGMKDMPSVMDLVLGPLGGPRPPDPMTVAKEALENMASRLPQSVTRLERIVRAMIQAFPPTSCGSYTTGEYGSLVTEFARAIEREMDKAVQSAEAS